MIGKRRKDVLHVFLDVDGVLNKESDWKMQYTIDDSCVKVLALIRDKMLQYYNQVIFVLTSTWRMGLTNKGERLDSPHGSILLDTLKREGIVITGSTPVLNNNRQAEIKSYINRNNVKDAIVIDDDPRLFTDMTSLNVYVPNYKTGLTTSDIKQIEKMIRRLL